MQPYFLPYIGYWQLLASANGFVLLDDAAFITRGWIHRNRILVGGEPHLFTVPLSGASQNLPISAIERADIDIWPQKFLKTLSQSYGKAPHFVEAMRILEPIVLHRERNLASYIHHSLSRMQEALGIGTPTWRASQRYDNQALKGQDRIVDICKREATGRYLNLPGGVDLYQPDAFEQHGIELRFLSPQLNAYEQRGREFVPALSIIDILMNVGTAGTQQMLAECALAPSDS